MSIVVPFDAHGFVEIFLANLVLFQPLEEPNIAGQFIEVLLAELLPLFPFPDLLASASAAFFRCFFALRSSFLDLASSFAFFV